MDPRPLRAIELRGGAVPLLVVAISLAGCSGSSERVASPRPLKVIVSGDTRGWIVPCGCTSNQSGGLARRGTYVAEQAKTADVILLDAGGAPGGVSEYDAIKAEAIFRGEMSMGLAAHNLGGPELALGADTLRRLAMKLGLPLISSNVRDADGKFLTEPYRLLERPQGKLLVLGVTDPKDAAEGLRIDSPREAVLAVLNGSPPAHDWLVVLAWLPEAELRELAGSLPEADLVLGGPTGQSVPPERIGPTTLASAANKGKFLVELTAPSTGEKGWQGRVVEMSAELADDPRQVKNTESFRGRLKDRDLSAAATGFVVPPGTVQAGSNVAGSEACRDCHADEHRTWAASGHAHAWTRLTKNAADADGYCQQCHTTGFGWSGGFVAVRKSPERVHVGCESCHGPSEPHANAPAVHTPLVARDQCRRCHDPENSPRFDLDSYWEKIAHGKSPAKAQAAGAP